MPLLACEIEWLADRYDAADDQGRPVPEWPPHPARLVAALLAGARTEQERDALRWLCTLSAPVITAGETCAGSVRRSWVPTNKTEAKGGHQVHPGRRNAGPKSWPRSIPPTATTTMRWTTNGAAVYLATLDALARRVPYLGRSTSHVLVRFWIDGTVSGGDSPDDWLPRPVGGAGTPVRVPDPTYIDRLVAAYAADVPAAEGARSRAVPYQLRRTAPEGPSAQDGDALCAYDRLVVRGFPRGVAFAPQFAVKIASALRAKVRERLNAQGEGDPARLVAVHGHREETDAETPQLAFIALPEVGFTHSTGEVRAVAVAFPVGLDPDVGVGVMRALRGDGFTDEGLTEISIPGLADLTDLATEPLPPVGRVTLSERHWCAPARDWVSATPVVLPRFPRRDLSPEDVVVEALGHVGLPVPSAVEWGRAAFVPGGVDLRAHQTVRHRAGRVMPFGHVRIRFSEPVAGPLLVGGMRHYGLGLLLPRREGLAR